MRIAHNDPEFPRCAQCFIFLYHTGGGEETISGPMCDYCIKRLDGFRHRKHKDLLSFLDGGNWVQMEREAPDWFIAWAGLFKMNEAPLDVAAQELWGEIRKRLEEGPTRKRESIK